MYDKIKMDAMRPCNYRDRPTNTVRSSKHWTQTLKIFVNFIKKTKPLDKIKTKHYWWNK